jgi:LacI family transcriptional regulator
MRSQGNYRCNLEVLLVLGWYYPEMHMGVARYAREQRWHVTFDFDEPIPQAWNGQGVLTLLGAGTDYWRQLKHLDLPMVDLAESHPEIPLPRVTMDNAEIATLAANYFIDRGFRQFAFVHRRDLGVSRRRSRYFQDIVRQHGYACHILSWQAERRRRRDNRQQRRAWLRGRLLALPKPLAVLARDIDAVEVLEACLSAGLNVPDQVSVLGIDNTETICNSLYISLSSIDPNLELIGYEGAALLDRLIQGEKPSVQPIYVPPRGIVERASTDSLATSHRHVAHALNFIRDHADQPIGMADIVKQVPMSRSGLEKAFREHYVRAPIEQLRHIRMDIARRLLRDTDESLSVIARKSGLQTAHNLCRVFRKEFHMTPNQYRATQASRNCP